MKGHILLIFLEALSLAHTLPINITSSLRSNSIFENFGTVSVSTSYAHIRVNLHLNDVITKFYQLVSLARQTKKIVDHNGNYTLANSHLLDSSRVVAESNIKRLTMVVAMLAPQHVKDTSDLMEHLAAQPLDLPQLNLTQQTTTPEPSRDKRQVLAGVSTVGSLISFGLSLYNTYQLTKLDSQMNALHDEVQLVAHQVESNSLKINEVIAMMDESKDVINKMYQDITLLKIDDVIRTYIEDVNILLQQFNSELSNYITGLLQFTQQTFSPLLLKERALEEVWLNIIEQSTKKGLRPVVDNRNLLFASKVSVITIPSKNSSFPWEDIYCYIHVPLSRGPPLNFYRHVASPVFVDKVLMRFHSHPFLALSEDQTLATELTSSELLRCRRFDSNWYCPHINRLNRQPHSLCAYSLFFNTQADKICKVSVAHVPSFAQEVAHGTFLVGSVTDYNMALTCSNGTTYLHRKAGTGLVHLPTNCVKASTDRHVLYRNQELSFEADLVQRPVQIPKDILQRDVPQTTNVHDKIVEHFLATRSLEPIDLTQFQNDLKLAELRYQAASASGFFTIVGYIVVAVLIMVLLACIGKAIWSWRQNRLHTNISPAQATFNKGSTTTNVKTALAPNANRRDDRLQAHEGDVQGRPPSSLSDGGVPRDRNVAFDPTTKKVDGKRGATSAVATENLPLYPDRKKPNMGRNSRPTSLPIP